MLRLRGLEIGLMVRRREAPSRTMGPPHPSRRVLRTLLRMRTERGLE
jgi:hypothetical protein